MRAWLDDEPLLLGPPAQRAVLGLLVLAGGQPVGLAGLIDALWGDQPPASAVNVIQTHVKRLRRLLEPGRAPHSRSEVLPYLGDSYRLGVPADQIDITRFRRLVRQAADAGEVAALTEALALWQGRPFADLPLLAEHPRVLSIVAEHRAALGRYGAAMLATGAVDRAISAFEEVAAADPLDEMGQARLVRAYAAAGLRAQAFTTYHAVRRRLADELGVAPGPELTAAYQQILDEDSRAHVLTGPAPVAADRTVPAELQADVPVFIGRAYELGELDRLTIAPEPDTVVIVVVSGPAGVGKTALATRWAHRARDRFPDGQLYIDLRGYDQEQPVSPSAALSRFLRSLGLPGEQVPGDVEERAARYRSLLNGRRMLILLDNVASVDQIRPLLPGSADSVVLVTSRDSLPGLVVRHGARRLDLDVLRREDALALLRRLVGQWVTVETGAAEALATQCARLPLAVRIAAELVHRRAPVDLAEVVGELADHRRRLNLLSTGDPHSDIGVVFSWSYRDLPPVAARMFRLLGLHPGTDVDVFGASALLGGEEATARESLELLAGRHQVQRNGDRYGMHDLLRAYAKDLAVRNGEVDLPHRVLEFYLHTAATAMDVLYPAERHRRPRVPRPAGALPTLHDEGTALAWLDAERANLVATAVHAAEHGQAWYPVQLALILPRYLETGGHYADAVTLHEHALRASESVPDHRSAARLRINLGGVAIHQGRYAEAGAELQRALELAYEVGDDLARMRALGDLGHVHQWQGRYPEAARLLAEAITLARLTGAKSTEARGLGDLGHVRLRQNRYADAADDLRASIAICRDIGDTVGEAYALAYLGHVQSALGRYDRASEHHAHALTLFRCATEPAGEAYALDGLGGVDLLRGEHEQALDHLSEALALFRRVRDRAGEARVANSLGEVAAAMGRLAEARGHHLSALRLAEDVGNRYEQSRARAGLDPQVEAEDQLASSGETPTMLDDPVSRPAL
ncbi:DNA-binding SARP family transcriptional activator [Actinomadura pelletieri DSM 43383]|uniref:DNA-binding SARP family transcriptional activator n=1 Tax=Actinomadura pelletieri DSM 43383 TaxID=1120940 RepID=A0A495QH48_9ACTN|nr:tetratricopeptide repeat protein [Actinomadura pelletieri]RKS71051.1 DNA-binding SARP family transcriptional activator [Actinomadura pelletieri DSM 43383]